MKRLIIYIPTYNRADRAARQIGAILRTSQRSLVEVVVADNASTQDYAAVISLCNENDLQYVRRVSNVGANPNIAEGFTLCNQADYLWILSDDDPLHHESVDRVLDLLCQEPDFLFLTHRQDTDDFPTWTFEDFLHNAILTSDGAGLISNVVYRCSRIVSSVPAGFEGIITCFPHLAVQLDSFQRHPSLRVRRLGSGAIFANTERTSKETDQNWDSPVPLQYQWSYFGFLLLADTIRNPRLRTMFVKRWATFGNLRSWYRCSDAGFRELYARAVLYRYAQCQSVIDLQLAFWRLVPIGLKLLQRLPQGWTIPIAKAARGIIRTT